MEFQDVQDIIIYIRRGNLRTSLKFHELQTSGRPVTVILSVCHKRKFSVVNQLKQKQKILH